MDPLTGLPVAVLSHDVAGRTRFRIAQRRGDRAYFEALVETLAQCPSVLQVSASSLTGSALVLHQSDSTAISTFARERGVFDLIEGPASAPFESMAGALRAVDGQLRARSQKRWGISEIGFYGLVGASLYQAARGRVLPPAVTLLYRAAEAFVASRQAEAERLSPTRGAQR